METQEEYLDRICSTPKPKKKRKTKKTQVQPKIFGYDWTDIQAMQQGTYKRKMLD